MSVMIENEELDTNEAIDEDEFFGDKQVRWYQVAARNHTEAALERGVTRILVVLPTGAGKTITSGLIFSSPRIRKALNIPKGEKLRLLFIAHKNRLLTQAERTYADAEGIEIILHSAFTQLTDKQLETGWDIACIDEAHHEAMMSIQYQLDKVGNKPIIGLTATPDRADGCLIKFEEIIEPISRQQAVEEGYLAPTKLYSFVDAPEKDKSKVVKDIIDSYSKDMGQTMIFMRTKKEASVIQEYLTRLGYNSVFIDNQNDREVDTILDAFGNKQYQFIVNCNKINEGVDVKGCESVLLGRTFGSYPQLNQVIGRAARPDSECRVWEIINPLSGRNLETTAIVGTPELHKLVYRKNGKWVEMEFDYSGSKQHVGFV